MCFEVFLNGRKLCLAGVGKVGVLTAHVTYAGTKNSVGRKRKSEEERIADLPWLHVGGLANGQHVRWVKHPFHLEIGDEIRVKIKDTKKFDQAPFTEPAKLRNRKKS